MFNNEELKKFRKVTYPGIMLNRYLISEDGMIYDNINNKLIARNTDKDGYFYVSYQNMTCTRNKAFVHRMVAWEWHPETRNIRLVVDHKDGNKQNNHYTNLEWVTIKENTNRAEALGLRNVKGSANGNSKYSEEFVHEICRMFVDGKSNMDVLREIKLYDKNTNTSGISSEDMALYRMIVRIRKKELWRSVSDQYNYPQEVFAEKIFKPNQNSIFNEEQVHTICKALSENQKPADILKSFGVFPSDPAWRKTLFSIYEIARGKTWKYISSQYTFESPGALLTKKYDIDEQIISYINQGYSKIDVYRAFGLKSSKSNVNLANAISRRYNKYSAIAKLKNNENIILGDNNWEAIQ